MAGPREQPNRERSNAGLEQMAVLPSLCVVGGDPNPMSERVLGVVLSSMDGDG